MEISRKRSKLAAVVAGQRLYAHRNVYTWGPISTQIPWRAWRRGAALLFWLGLCMYILEKGYRQDAHAAATPQTEILPKERGGQPVEQDIVTEPTSKSPPSQKDGAPLRPFWTVLTPLPVLPFANQQPAVPTASVKRVANVARRRGLGTGEQRVSTKQARAEVPSQEIQGKSAAQGYGLEPEDPQAQSAILNGDYSYIRKRLRQRAGETVESNWPAKTALNTLMKKVAEAARNVDYAKATTDDFEPTAEELQRAHLTAGVHQVLHELVTQPPHSSVLRDNRGAPNSAQGSPEAANYLPAHEAKEERIGLETREKERAKKFAAADAASGFPAAADDYLSLSTAEDEAFWEDPEGSDSEYSVLEDAADSKKFYLLLREASDSLKQNKALQHIVETPLYRRHTGAETEEDGGPRIVWKSVGKDVEVQGNDPRPGNSEKGSAPTGHTGVLGAGEGIEEETSNKAGVVISSSAFTSADYRIASQNAPHHPVRFTPGVVPDAAADPETVGRPKSLTVSQLEPLLRTRSQQHRRRSLSRPMTFPSCFFDAPMQKRMRAKTSVLTAALEQLNEAVEALAELGEVVEKEAEVVEKAAFTLVYRDRFVSESVSATRPLAAGAAEKEGEIEMHKKQTNEQLPNARVEHMLKNVRTTVEERQQPAPPPQVIQASDANAFTAEGQPEFSELQIEDDKYKKLVGSNGVRKQLRELFATWELARRAAAAAEMANEIMRRAETLRRDVVLPLQHDVQRLSLLDASPNPIAVQRLAGCKGFIKAVRRTVSRAEEDLYNLGAHAFASEVSLPLMAHGLQRHVADLLEHVVQLQLQHHRALHTRATTLQALHRTFFKSARSLQQNATERLKDTRLLLATSPEEWHKLAQDLASGSFALRVDLARQLVALRSADKKAARLEGILTFLQGGLEHLLQTDGQLQRIMRSSTMSHHWFGLDDEELKNEVSVHTVVNDKSAEGPVDGIPLFDKDNNGDTTELTREKQQHLLRLDSVQNETAFQQSKTLRNAGEPFRLVSPPQLEQNRFIGVNKDLFEDEPKQTEENSARTLRRLQLKVTQMWERLQMYKRQSSDAELLLRNRFYIAQETVQKATLVAKMVMAQSHIVDRKQQEQSLREKLPSLVQSIQHQEVARARAEAAVEDSAAHVGQLNRKVRYIDAALSFIEGSPDEENRAAGREVVARIDGINGRLFSNPQSDAEESKRSHGTSAHHDEVDIAEEVFNEGLQGAGDGGNTTDKDSDATRELLESELAATLEALQDAQYHQSQRKQELDTVEAALRQNRMLLEVHLRILDEIREAGGSRLSRLTSAKIRRGVVQKPTEEAVGGHNWNENSTEARKGQHIFAKGGSLAAIAGVLAAVAAKGKKSPLPTRTPERTSQNKKEPTATRASSLDRVGHLEQKPASQEGA